MTPLGRGVHVQVSGSSGIIKNGVVMERHGRGEEYLIESVISRRFIIISDRSLVHINCTEDKVYVQ